ncbi:hypothetical protein RB653_007006 [Dictyostelium firmibasis]|uniref:Uncharacterized protein n=1 Tax=Dictyostelium firmibasis TaxID=79012 RepID=A0AAN7YU93_9MYCE
MNQYINRLPNSVYCKLLLYANRLELNQTIFLEGQPIFFKSPTNSYKVDPLMGNIHFVLSENQRVKRKEKNKGIKFHCSQPEEVLGCDREGRTFYCKKFSNRDISGIKITLLECSMKLQNNTILLRHFIQSEIVTIKPSLESIKIRDMNNNEIQPTEEFTGLIGNSGNDSPLSNNIEDENNGPLYQDYDGPDFDNLFDQNEEV